MQGCFYIFVLIGALVFVVASITRWFEQTAWAVDQRMWDRVILLVLMPFTVWLFPSRVAAGRPIAAPRHEPVMGMGAAPKPRPAPRAKPEEASPQASDEQTTAASIPAPRTASPQPVLPIDNGEGPPPGTPKEFLGMPVVPPKAKHPKGGIEQDKIERLRQKMREQGMLDE